MERCMIPENVVRTHQAGYGLLGITVMPRDEAKALTEEVIRDKCVTVAGLADAVIDRLWRLGWGQTVEFEHGGWRVTLTRGRDNPYGWPIIDAERED